MRRMRRSSPDKILHYLNDPTPSDDYHHLDALATLCSFASAQCDSVSGAVEYREDSNHLYLVASPSAPPPLQDLLPAWIDLMQKLPARGTSLRSFARYPDLDSESDFESELDFDSELESDDDSEPDADGPMDRAYTGPEQTFIVAVYRACHARLLDAVDRDGAGQRLLDFVGGEMLPWHFRAFGIAGAPFVASVELLVSMAKKLRPESRAALSAEDLLRVHRAAGVVGQLNDRIPDRHMCESCLVKIVPRVDSSLTHSLTHCPANFAVLLVLRDADRLSHAVDALVAFAASSAHKARVRLPWTVVWVDVPSARGPFLATTDSDALARMLDKDKKLYDELVSASARWPPFEPSGDVRAVEGSPGRFGFTGHGVVHCESAMLYHIFSTGRLSIAPYIGCSHPVCYACLSLVRAYNRVFDTGIRVGCRCPDLTQLDIAWSFPAMGAAVDRWMGECVVQDFVRLLTQPDYQTVVPLGERETLPQ